MGQTHSQEVDFGDIGDLPENKCSTLSSTSGDNNKINELQVRKLSNVSNRNIQLLSMRPRSEKDAFVDNLKGRRRSSLINLILGAPSRGPGFSDDLCSINSRYSNFGIEFFPDTYHAATSQSSLHIGSIDDIEIGPQPKGIVKFQQHQQHQNYKQHKRRRSSVGSITIENEHQEKSSSEKQQERQGQKVDHLQRKQLAPSVYAQQARQHFTSKSSIESTLASIDLTSSFERHDFSKSDKSGRSLPQQFYRPPQQDAMQQSKAQDIRARMAAGRVSQASRVLRRTGSELSLYSYMSASSQRSGSQNRSGSSSSSADLKNNKKPIDPMSETKLIIIMQVCIPFILAGFGNMSAGLILNWVSEWRSFHSVPIFFILLPPFIGLKGNIEMTLASRLSTLSNLNLLETSNQKRRAFFSNLVLTLGQAIGLSIFAAIISIGCEMLIGHNKIHAGNSSMLEISLLVVLASALATSVLLVMTACIVMSLAVSLARYVQVNPDNLSTLVAALYGDVTCVLTYGLICNWMFNLREKDDLFWPVLIIVSVLSAWPLLIYAAHKFEETNHIAISSLPPMLASICISMGSGAVLSTFIDRFHLIALYQPVVNGFGANLIAVQASRVSTWLWCSALRKMSTVSISKEADSITQDKKPKVLGSMVSFTEPVVIEDRVKSKFRISELVKIITKPIKTLLWSFLNSSPNAIAARLLLIMMVPAHTLYFFIIMLVSPSTHIVITWQFYSIYIGLCLIQVFILLTICEPLMTLLMSRQFDPDVFGISLLMALADLTGTLCLAGAFALLAGIGDPNAT